MAADPMPWFRKGRGWFVTIEGKQLALGVVDAGQGRAALAALHTLLRSFEQSRAASTTVGAAVSAYLAEAEERVGVKTLSYYRRHLGELVEAFGGRSVSDCPPAEVERWARERGWSAATRRGFLQTCEACLRGAGVDWRAQKPRKVRSPVCVTAEAYWQVRGAARGDFRGYVDVLWHTGARPSEVAGLTVEGVDWRNGLARLVEHKCAEVGKPRVIHFPEVAMLVLVKQRQRWGTGALFRNEAGRPLCAYQAGRRLWRICQRLGVRATLYGMRHAWATAALECGVPDAHVAELLGHSGTATLHRNYNHLGDRHRVLQESLSRVRAVG